MLKIEGALARAILDAGLEEDSALKACRAVLGRHYVFAKSLVKRIVAHFGAGSRTRERRLIAFLASDRGWNRACSRHDFQWAIPLDVPRRMQPAKGPPETWDLPPLLTVDELAQWLGIEYQKLLWLADSRGMEGKIPDGPLRHYRRLWVPKRQGAPRLIESPKPLLKSIQRQILTQLLNRIPPHDGAHGFRRGRSALSHASAHVGRELVLRMDIRDFFPSIQRSRLIGVWIAAGYPESVACCLADLCCVSTPRDVMASCPGEFGAGDRWLMGKKLQVPHLPQGAPTSPALANLCAYRLDLRLAGLSKSFGATYTRYADDLTFSGDAAFARRIERFGTWVGAIALEEGFELNYRKTRIMRRSQSQRTAGIVINSRLNPPREQFDRLEAILFNCVRYGPHSQNRAHHPEFRAHLVGRIEQMGSLHRARAEKLLKLFRQIHWEP